MSKNQSCGAQGMFLGLCVGLLAGAATALLLTPRSGEDTRALLTDKANDAKTVLGERVHSMQEAATTQLHTLQETATTQLQGVREKATDLVGKAKTVIDEYVPQNVRVKLAKDVSHKIEDGLQQLATL
jgi:gas vesicle protein